MHVCMGHKHHNKKSKRSHSKSKSSHDDVFFKLLKYAALGKVHRLRLLIDTEQDPQLVNTTSDDGATALHQVRYSGRRHVKQQLVA